MNSSFSEDSQVIQKAISLTKKNRIKIWNSNFTHDTFVIVSSIVFGCFIIGYVIQSAPSYNFISYMVAWLLLVYAFIKYRHIMTTINKAKFNATVYNDTILYLNQNLSKKALKVVVAHLKTVSGPVTVGSLSECMSVLEKMKTDRNDEIIKKVQIEMLTSGKNQQDARINN